MQKFDFLHLDFIAGIDKDVHLSFIWARIISKLCQRSEEKVWAKEHTKPSWFPEM